MQGDFEEIQSNGIEARVLQHETDHFHGQIMIHSKISEGRLKSDNPSVQKVIQSIEAEISKRRDKLEYLENKSETLKSRIKNAERPREEVCNDIIFTQELHLRIFSDIGDALYGCEIEKEEFKDMTWIQFVTTFEDDIMRKGSAKTPKKPK